LLQDAFRPPSAIDINLDRTRIFQAQRSIMDLQLISESICFGGTVGYYSHPSTCCHGEMKFSIYQPAQAQIRPLPVLYFLSGLTCTEENFMAKAGAQQFATKYGVTLIAPDTSPRHTGTPGEDDDWDFGTGAGFYVDAIAQPWSAHYRMYSYVTEELPALIQEHFPVCDRASIFGHSMGGHGALVCALRNPERYRSVSAFAPIVAPMQVAWGQKALSRYLGDERSRWQQYDACELVQQAKFHSPILIDQGMSDRFLSEQLRPELFEQACQAVGQSLTVRRQPGYDHSYYFIATFIEDHIRYHAEALR
jgi:S-formylglutathione hydrolase